MLTPGPNEDEIIGLDHPSVTQAIVEKLLPNGPHIPIADLKTVGILLVNSDAYNSSPVGGLRALAERLNDSLDRDFRAAQERNLKMTGKARP